MNDNFERLDLIRRLSEIRSYYNCFNEKERKVYHTLSEAIEALQEQKMGKWISQVGGGYCCSKCGRYALHDIDGKFALLFTKSKYCPNCGAKMEVQDD